MFAVDDGHVLPYARGDAKRGVVAQRTRYDACRVDVMPPKALIEVCRGMYCMINHLGRFLFSYLFKNRPDFFYSIWIVWFKSILILSLDSHNRCSIGDAILVERLNSEMISLIHR